MSLSHNDRIPPRDMDFEPTPVGLEQYAHVEGLVGEEDRLLEEVEERRDKARHERLHAVSGELDRIWAVLRDRAERRRRHGEKPKPPA